MQAMRHAEGVSAMPPDKPRLPIAVINDFTTWIQMGAPDPRVGKAEMGDKAAEWESDCGVAAERRRGQDTRSSGQSISRPQSSHKRRLGPLTGPRMSVQWT